MTMPDLPLNHASSGPDLYRDVAMAHETKESVFPAYGPDECYDDCMATSRDGSPASRRFAKFCAVACG
jgi:hypothetical protein